VKSIPQAMSRMSFGKYLHLFHLYNIYYVSVHSRLPEILGPMNTRYTEDPKLEKFDQQSQVLYSAATQLSGLAGSRFQPYGGDTQVS